MELLKEYLEDKRKEYIYNKITNLIYVDEKTLIAVPCISLIKRYIHYYKEYYKYIVMNKRRETEICRNELIIISIKILTLITKEELRDAIKYMYNE